MVFRALKQLFVSLLDAKGSSSYLSSDARKSKLGASPERARTLKGNTDPKATSSQVLSTEPSLVINVKPSTSIVTTVTPASPTHRGYALIGVKSSNASKVVEAPVSTFSWTQDAHGLKIQRDSPRRDKDVFPGSRPPLSIPDAPLPTQSHHISPPPTMSVPSPASPTSLGRLVENFDEHPLGLVHEIGETAFDRLPHVGGLTDYESTVFPDTASIEEESSEDDQEELSDLRRYFPPGSGHQENRDEVNSRMQETLAALYRTVGKDEEFAIFEDWINYRRRLRVGNVHTSL